jgi:hypothetical protein
MRTIAVASLTSKALGMFINRADTLADRRNWNRDTSFVNYILEKKDG